MRLVLVVLLAEGNYSSVVACPRCRSLTYEQSALSHGYEIARDIIISYAVVTEDDIYGALPQLG